MIVTIYLTVGHHRVAATYFRNCIQVWWILTNTTVHLIYAIPKRCGLTLRSVGPSLHFGMGNLDSRWRTDSGLSSRQLTTNVSCNQLLVLRLWLTRFMWNSLNALQPTRTSPKLDVGVCKTMISSHRLPFQQIRLLQSSASSPAYCSLLQWAILRV